MAVLKILLTVLFIIVCIALAIIILLQESKSSGLGAISGAADTYWGKNKGRSMEGKLEKGTKVLVILFFIFSILLNIPSIADNGANSNANTTKVENNSNTNATDGAANSDTTDDAAESEAEIGSGDVTSGESAE